MHLNDQQLIELDEGNLNHITSCSVCRQRLEVLKQLRAGLQDIDIPESFIPLNDGWQALKLAQQAQQQQPNVSYNLNSKRGQRWWISSLSLAASIVLIAIIFHDKYIVAPQINHDIQLAALIEQNNLLQKKLAAMQENNNKTIEGYGQLRYLLTSLDQQIQQAYIDTKPAEQKLLLWLERQKTIERWFEKKEAPKSIKI